MRFITLFFLVIFCSAANSTQANDETNEVPGIILSKMKSGVNLSHWFDHNAPSYPASYCSSASFKNYLTPVTFRAFKALNLTFVRLPIYPYFILNADNTVNTSLLPCIDYALQQLTNAGLLVFLDFHDTNAGNLSTLTEAYETELSTFWTTLATRYNTKYRGENGGLKGGQLVFELLNEPGFANSTAAWYTFQSSLVDAIRFIDEDRTILVTPNVWGGIDQLTRMTPLKQKDLIYSFHMYDPQAFTQQGASWESGPVSVGLGLPFPSSVAAVQPVLANPQYSQYSEYITSYGAGNYNAEWLSARMKLADDWGRNNNVPVLMGEFGALPGSAPVTSRANWFMAMRNAIKQYNMPNALWGYDDGFGFGRVVHANGSITLDALTLRNLYNFYGGATFY